MTPEQEILADHLIRTDALAKTLTHHRTEVRRYIPVSGNPYLIEMAASTSVWAFVKQFELFHDAVGRKLLRSVAAIDGTPLRTRDVRQLLEWSAQNGLLNDLDRWRELAKLRNTLAHEYIVPLSSFDVVINDAWAACDDLFAAHIVIVDYIDRHRLMDTKDDR